MGTDRDIEFSFTMGPHAFEGDHRIEFWKSETARAIDLLHCLNDIALEQTRRQIVVDIMKSSNNVNFDDTQKASAIITEPYTWIFNRYFP